MATLNTNPNQSVISASSKSTLPNLSGVSVKGTPAPTVSSGLVGVQAKAPTVTPPTNTLPSNQTKTVAVKATPTTPTTSASYNIDLSKVPQGPTKAPDDPSNMYNTATGQLNTKYSGYVAPQTQQAPTVQPQANQTQTYDQNNSGLYGQLIANLANQSNQSSQPATGIVSQLQDMSTNTSDIDKARSELSKQIGLDADAQAAISNQAIPLQFQQGRSQILQQVQAQKEAQLQGILGNLLTQRGQNISGLTSAGGLANSQQGLLQQALQGAAQGAAPQFPSYNSAQYNPTSNTYGTVGGGQYGSGPAAAANITSIQQAQTGINDINQNSQAIDNQFSAAVNYAQQAGLTGNSPIIAGFKNRFGTNFATNPAVVGFNQAINGLNQQLQQLGEAPIDINNATMTTIQQAQQTVKADLARKISNYQDYINNPTGNTNNGSSGGAANPWH